MCNNNRFITFQSRLARVIALLFPLILAVYVRPGVAQPSATKAFPSAEAAAAALFQAAQNGDERRLEAILGSGKDITSSGEEVEDKQEREQFAEKYQEMHRLVQEADGSRVLYIGAENWPFPIPLVSTNGGWRFDSDAGRQEILLRTIGQNEFTAIGVCDAFATARESAHGSTEATDDPISAYAHNLLSTSATDPSNAAPFHGYYFRSTKSRNVMLIAYPATYRSSGLETFLITSDGVVYGKDLGPNTSEVTPKVKLDSSWHQE